MAFAQGKTMKHNDTTLVIRLDTVNVTAGRQWQNDVTRYKYNQMKFYVTTILPYLNEATKLFKELDQKVNDKSIRKKERKAFVNSKEQELREHFEDEVKKLNETQGVLLVKLIGRQTGVNIYSMLNEFKNPLTAIKWQTWSRINGFNLNKRYDPDEEPMLEHIMESLNYPLPPVYGEREQVVLKEGDVYY
jgi:hypothetical protein